MKRLSHRRHKLQIFVRFRTGNADGRIMGGRGSRNGSASTTSTMRIALFDITMRPVAAVDAKSKCMDHVVTFSSSTYRFSS